MTSTFEELTEKQKDRQIDDLIRKNNSYEEKLNKLVKNNELFTEAYKMGFKDGFQAGMEE